MAYLTLLFAASFVVHITVELVANGVAETAEIIGAVASTGTVVVNVRSVDVAVFPLPSLDSTI